jgi:hypothetical protein
MAFSVNDNGTWKTVKKLSVNDGTWKAVKSGWINKNGIWTKFYSGTTTVNVTSQNNINLRTLYTNQTGDSSSDAVSVIYNINGNIGSTSSGTASMVTGTWTAGSEIIINVASGVYIAGAGGGTGSAGGGAISLSYNVTIANNGVIGGGGGSGGTVGDFKSSTQQYFYGYGGAGAGLVNGSLYNASVGTSYYFTQSNRGTTSVGSGTGGTGGSLGQAGSPGTTGSRVSNFPAPTAPQAGGKAVALNNNTVTWSPQGTTFGSIS